MDFAQLKRFIAVVEGGSFGKAADNLSLSRTTLALQKAIRACRTEQSRASSRPRPRRCQIMH